MRRSTYRLGAAESAAQIAAGLGVVRVPNDFTTFLNAYGSGAICSELVVFHPQGSRPLLERMRRTHRSFTEHRDRILGFGDSEHVPYPFHPEFGGLISWGYDHSGDEHFFLPCDPDPNRWKVVTMVHEEGCETFDGPFSAFALVFVRRLLDVDRYHGIDPEALAYLEPEDLEELVTVGEIGPVRPVVRTGARFERGQLVERPRTTAA